MSNPATPPPGPIITRLREARAISQTSLAKLSGISNATINRIENGTLAKTTAITALKIFGGFRDSGQPLNEHEAKEFFAAFNMGYKQTPGTSFHKLPEHPRPLASTPTPPPAAQAADDLDALFARVREQVGAEALRAMLEGMAAAVNLIHGKAPMEHRDIHPENVLTITSPPVQKDGYTEQVKTEYAASNQPARKPRHSTAAIPPPRKAR